MVAVFAFASNLTTWSIGLSERNSALVSAIVLKQWRVPSPLSLFRFLTKSCTSFTDFAEYSLWVPYSILPAQLVSLSLDDHVSSGESTRLVSTAEQAFRKVLLFIFPPRHCSIQSESTGSMSWVVRIHFWCTQTRHLQRSQHKCVPGEHAVIPEERMAWIGCQIFLAGGKLGCNINLRPKAVRNGLIRSRPSLALPGHVSTYLHSPPPPT